jgi:hypothetical protein
MSVTPINEGSLGFAYSRTNQQTVTTNTNTYTLPWNIPIDPAIALPASIGTLTFQAFQALSAALVVVDYIQDPEWWLNITLSESVLPGMPNAGDRTISPNLVPNVIGPIGDFNIGDPGYYIGAGELGGSTAYVSPATTVAAGSNGVALPTGTIHVTGNPITLGFPTIGELQIITASGPTLVTYTNITSNTFTGCVGGTGTLATSQPIECTSVENGWRHRASFILMDKFLKTHIFGVDINPNIDLTGKLIGELQNVIQQAKPVQTAVYFTPIGVFTDRVRFLESVLALIPQWTATREVFAHVDNTLRVGSPQLIGYGFLYSNTTDGTYTTAPADATHTAFIVGGLDPSISATAGSPKYLERPLYVSHT